MLGGIWDEAIVTLAKLTAETHVATAINTNTVSTFTILSCCSRTVVVSAVSGSEGRGEEEGTLKNAHETFGLSLNRTPSESQGSKEKWW